MTNELLEMWQQYFQGDVDWKQVILIGCTPLFFIGFAIELHIRKRKGPGHHMWNQFNLRETIANLMLGGAYQLFELVAHALFMAAAIAWFYQYRLFDVPVNGWTIVPIFVGMEFCYYWFHRTSHRVRWFWTAHVVHHSSEEMNMTTAMRQSLLYSITGWWLFFMPLVVLGVNPAVVFALYACNLAYQFFIHTEAVDKLHPILEYWLDTPSNHRVHHGRNPEYIDKNYGGVLIIFDRLFGTYAEEKDRVQYGIVEQVNSKNILTLNFHEFIDMWADVFKTSRQAGGLLGGLKHIVKPPEWNRNSAVFVESQQPEAKEPSVS